MSVSRGGAVPGYDGYDDLRRQHVRTDLFSPESDRGNVDGDVEWGPGYEINPVTERDEMTELVVVELVRLQARARERDNVGTTPGHVDAAVDMSTSPLTQTDRENQDTVDPTDSSIDGDASTFGVQQVGIEDSSETIMLFYDTGTTPFNDTVNGTGGGPGYSDDSGPLQYVNMREIFGRGPIFDRHDSIFLNGTLQGIESPNQDWQLLCTFHLYWNDFERPEGQF